jgi:hypothetical protein
MPRRSPKHCRRYVDMWALPGIHPSNNEFLQKLKTADAQQFTKNMDTVGTVSEQNPETKKWSKTHLIGVRTDIWKPDEQEMARSLEVMREKRKEELRRGIKKSGRLNSKQLKSLDEKLEQDDVMSMQSDDIEKRRLVLKLFKTTTSRVRWCGTIEEVTTTEVHNSLGSRKSLLTMAIMLPKTESITTIQQNHRTYRVPSIFSFCYVDDGEVFHLMLRRRWFAIGADFDILCENKSLGLIDGRLFGFGSDSYVNLSDHELSANTPFIDLLTLFAASVGYHAAMRRSIKSRVQANRSGQSHRHLVEDEELRLRNNGRAA